MEDLRITCKVVKMASIKVIVAFTICIKATKCKWAQSTINCKTKNLNKSKMSRMVKCFEWIMFHISSSSKMRNRKVLMLIEVMKQVSPTIS